MVAQGESGVESATVVVLVESGNDIGIANALVGGAVKIHAAVESREAPEVLVFKVAAIGPAEAFHCKQVASRLHVFCDVPFSRTFRHLSVAHFSAVNPHIHSGKTRLEVEIHAAAFHRLWQLE